MAQLKTIFAGDAGKLIREQQKAIDSLSKMVDKLRETGRESRKSNTEHKTGLNSIIQGVGAAALGYMGLSQAIGMARQAMQALNEERERAASQIREGEFARSSLAQLAGGDPAEMRRMLTAAGASRVEFGMPDIAAHQLQFSLESLGLGRERKLFGSLYGVVEEPAQIAEAVGTLQAAMGIKETGNARQVLNKLLAASAVSKTTLEEFGPAVTRSAQEIKGIGGRDEELLASLAVLSRGTASAEEASTRIGALARAGLRHGLGGKGLLSLVDELEAKNLSEQDMIKFLGRARAYQGYQLIRGNRGLIEETLGKVSAAQAVGPRDMTAGVLATVESDAQIAAARQTRRTEQELQISEEEAFGPHGLRLRDEEARLRRGLIAPGIQGPERLIRGAAIGAAREMTGSVAIMQRLDRIVDVWEKMMRRTPNIYGIAYQAGLFGGTEPAPTPAPRPTE